MDQNCVVFDNEEENKLEYTAIHKRFKEMLGLLFDSMMEEVGLEQEKLLELISIGMRGKYAPLFEQILIADDFLKFKAIMLKRNNELEQIAFQELERSRHSKAPVQASGPKS